MNFGFSEEQDLLRQQVRKFLDERCPLDEVRRLVETPEGHSRELWKQLGELGFLGLAIPSEHGGAGLGWVDLVVLLEETGRTLFPSPLVSTTLAGAGILTAGSEAQQRRWLPELADGSRIGALALFDVPDRLSGAGITLRAAPQGGELVLQGCKPFVADAEAADLLLVGLRLADGDDAIRLALVEANAPGVRVEALPPLDATKRLATIHLDGVRVAGDAVLDRGGWRVVESLIEKGAAAVTAEMVGASEAVLDLTVEYAKQRIQFGSPIGRYQGVKHPLAEMYMNVESLKSLLYYAAWALDKAPSEVSRAVSEAKAFGSLVSSRAAIDGIQLHGAVGYTREYDIQLYLRRSKWARPMFGDEDHHHDRIATLGGY